MIHTKRLHFALDLVITHLWLSKQSLKEMRDNLLQKPSGFEKRGKNQQTQVFQSKDTKLKTK